MTDEMPTSPAEDTLADLPPSYDRWRARVHGWLSKKTRDELADAVLLLPDLLAFAWRLVRDSRTPLFIKSQLLLIIGYVVLPVDFIPEAVFGAAGLADDAVLLSIMLMRLVQNAATLDDELLNEHWAGNGNVKDTLQEVVENGGELLNTTVFQRLQNLLGNKTPDPPIVDMPPHQQEE